MTDEKISRLQHTVRKLSQWAGVDISELIEEGYIEEEDME